MEIDVLRKHYECSVYSFSEDGQKELLTEFYKKRHSIAIGCEYIDAMDMWCLKGPGRDIDRARSLLQSIVKKYIADHENVSRGQTADDTIPRVRRFAESVSIDLNDDTPDDNHLVSATRSLPINSSINVTEHRICLPSSKNKARTIIELLHQHELSDDRVTRILTPMYKGLPGIYANSYSCYLARPVDFLGRKHTFNARQGALLPPLSTTTARQLASFDPWPRVQELPADLPIPVSEQISDSIQVRMSSTTAAPIKEWIEQVSPIAPRQASDLPLNKARRQPAVLGDRPLPGIGRLRVPEGHDPGYRSGRGSPVDMSCYDSDEDDDAFSFQTKLAGATGNGQVPPPRPSSSQLADHSQHPNASLPTQARAAAAAKLQAEADSSHFASAQQHRTKLATHRDVHSVANHHFFPEHGKKYSTVDKHGLRGHAKATVDWCMKNGFMQKPEQKRWPISLRSPSTLVVLQIGSAEKVSDESKVDSAFQTMLEPVDKPASWEKNKVTVDSPTGMLISDVSAQPSSVPVKEPSHRRLHRKCYWRQHSPGASFKSANFPPLGIEKSSMNRMTVPLNIYTPRKVKATRPASTDVGDLIDFTEDADAKSEETSQDHLLVHLMPETVLHNTMRQQAKRKNKNKSSTKRRLTTLPSVPPEPKRLTSNSTELAVSDSKISASGSSNSILDHDVPDDLPLGDLIDAISKDCTPTNGATSDALEDRDSADNMADADRPLADMANYRLKAEVGLILCRFPGDRKEDDGPGQHTFTAVELERHLNAAANRVLFNKRLTTSTNDACHMLAMPAVPDEHAIARGFLDIHVGANKQLYSISVSMENLDDIAVHLIEPPVSEEMLHVPAHVWDARLSLHRDVAITAKDDIFDAIKALTDSIQFIGIPPSFRAAIPLNIGVDKVLAKREFTRQFDDITIHATEIQELELINFEGMDLEFYAQVAEREVMMDTQRLWWEFRLETHDIARVDALRDMISDCVTKMDGIGFANIGAFVRTTEAERDTSPSTRSASPVKQITW